MPKTSKRDPDNPVWTKEDFARAVPFSGLPASLQAKIKGHGKRRVQKAAKKVAVSIRLSPEVVKALRSSGAGWQARVDEILRERLAV